jgi:cytoskeletal protein CcmA (bactofilin family)
MNIMARKENDLVSINILRYGTNIEGNIRTNGDIRIDGILKGSLTCEGKLVVGESGVIEGEIFCKSADISGNLKAKISVKELLQLRSTANINGDIFTSKIAIEPGANFTGNCRMGAVVKGMEKTTDSENSNKSRILEEKSA